MPVQPVLLCPHPCSSLRSWPRHPWVLGQGAAHSIPVLRRQELTRREVVDVTHLEIPAELMGLLEAAAGERVPHHRRSQPLVSPSTAVPYLPAVPQPLGR